MGVGRGTCCKRIIASVLGAAIVAVIVGVCAYYVPKHNHNKSIDDGLPQVTNKDAFKNGGAAKHAAKDKDGKKNATDEYTLYQGGWEKFPKSDDWVSFDHMWKSNLGKVKTSCKDHGWGENNSDDENDMIKSQIEWVSRASLVDHRFILAIVLQESKGCLRVISTNSNHGVHNPGLMQSHDGASFNTSDVKNSIRQMIKDGTQGTPKGDGLVQTLDKFGNAYSAARCYNSGDVAHSGDLGDAIGATKCYATDVANRLMGWVRAESKCDEKTFGTQQSPATDGQTKGDGGEVQSEPPTSNDGNDQQSSSSSSSTSSASGANADGTFTGGHWDINGNYVKDGGDGGGGGSTKKRRAVFRA